MRFHVLGIPHTVSSKEYVACAYTQKVVKFCKMMSERGHEIIHYGHEDSEVQCAEHVVVVTNEDFLYSYGASDWKKSFFKHDMGDLVYQLFYKNAIKEIAKRKQPNDFLLPFWGLGVKPICDAHNDMIVVEPGIGYSSGCWANYKVFESYAIYHAFYGLQSVGNCMQNWYDTVIPNYFDPDDFEYNDKKDDYYLYLGRVYAGKGVNIAIQVTEVIGGKLIIAGQGSLKEMGYAETPKHVTEFGYANVEDRKKLMSRAKALFLPSLYNEPFGGVQIESLFSGTPTITTDWGAFTENNIHGITGYRCKTFEQFIWAAKNIGNINPKNCRAFAENFALEKVAKMYEEYFESILKIYSGDGWYALNSERENMNLLNKNIPSCKSNL